MEIQALIERYAPEVLRVRKHLHRHPELSLQEYETSAFIQAELRRYGIPFEVLAGGRSIVASIVGGRPGKTIVMRGDMDALPIQELVDIDCKSETPGVMHACGHDCHTAMVLGAGLVLNEVKDQLSGTVKLLFQEGEEVGCGAANALKTGALDDCDNSLGIHLIPHKDTGTFVTRYGLFCAKTAWAKITIFGRKGHVANPDLAVNPLVIAADVIGAISHMLAYEIPRRDYVIAAPTVISGGDTVNIIPDRCTVTYNLRYFDEAYDKLIPERFLKIAAAFAESCGGRAELEYGAESLPMYNDHECTARAERVVKRHFGEQALQITPPELFSDDFAYIQQRIPGTMMNLGMARDGHYTIGHNGGYLVDESVLDLGVSYLVHYCLDYFGLE